MPDLTFPGPTGADLRGYLAVPPVGEGPWPGVVVVHEIFGLQDDTRQQADRLAAAGYLALAPDLYTNGGALRCVRATMTALQAGHGPAVDDLEAARGWLLARPDCSGRVGVIGFCMGGGFALVLAPRGFDASAPNYGPLPDDLEGSLRGACPVVASFGGRDRSLPGAAERLERALTDLDVPHDVREYPEAGHSFLNRHNGGPLNVLARVGGVGYHHPSAEDAWGRILRFFDQHLRG